MAEEARACRECGCPESEHDYKTGKCNACFCEQFDPAPDQGERDGLAERLEARARHAQWDGESRLRSKAEAGIRAAAFREAAAMARDESSTEGAARPGDSPLNDTRTNSDRPWREDVARAFVTNRPAQSPTEPEALVGLIAETLLADLDLMHPFPDTEDTTGLIYEAAESVANALQFAEREGTDDG